MSRSRCENARPRCSALLFLALAPLLLGARGARAAQEPSAEPSAAELFVELEPSTRTLLVEEELVLRVRFGIESLAARPLLVQPFQRALEIPIQLRAPWLAAPPGLERLPALGDDPAAPRCALDGAPCAARARGEIERDGRTYAIWEIERRFAAPLAGRLRFPSVEALCVLGLRREQDLFGETQIVGRRELSARSAELELEVVEAPIADRPTGYRDAVGRFEIEAALDRSALRHDEVLRLELRVRGTGNLERLTLPALDDLPAFHRLGMLEEVRPGVRIARYDLAPRASGKIALGPLELPHLDPGPPARFLVARSAALEVDVAPDPSATPSSAATAEEPPWWSGLWLPIVACALAMAAALALFFRRVAARRRANAAPRSLGARFAERTRASSNSDASAVVLELLAAWLGCSPAALHGSSVAERLEARGARPETARALAEAIGRAIAARYGSRGPELSSARWIELLDALEREGADRTGARAASRAV